LSYLLFVCMVVMIFACVFLVTFVLYLLFFFFQAEDGIRDRNVTGVQTCALPISVLLLLFSISSCPFIKIACKFSAFSCNIVPCLFKIDCMLLMTLSDCDWI